MKCWHELTIPTAGALRPGWTLPADPKPWAIYDPTLTDIFTDDWLRWMTLIGLPVCQAILFYKQPWARSPIAHIDMSTPTRPKAFAFNWVLGGKGSKMLWYTGHEGKAGAASLTMVETDYLSWPKTELTLIDSHEVKQELTLVRTDVPHSIDVEAEPRWCISVRVPDSVIGASWNEAVAKLQHLIIG